MDVYSIVTERILNSLEQGIIPWRRPWITVGNGAYNQMTGHRYSILNQMLLSHGPGPYATYRQWTTAGYTLREDAKSDIVVFFKWPGPSPDDDENTEENQEKTNQRRPVLRYYRVYHASQVDGDVQPYYPEPELYDTEPCEEAERLFYQYVRREGIHLEEGLSNEAYYSPSQDVIHIPSIRQYEYAEEYYATAFHESIHHAECRLNRGVQNVHFGSESYSRGELVAEIGSACILNSLGIESPESIRNSNAYIQGWSRKLREKSNRKLIVTAATQAQKAVVYIMDK